MILGTEANLIEEAYHSHSQFLASPLVKGLRNNAEARTEATQARVINTPVAQLKKCKLSMKLKDRGRKSTYGQQLPIS